MDEAVLDFTSYPLDGEKSVLRSVVFGPLSDEFATLIELNPETGLLRVTIGNGPQNADIPNTIPEVLREVADLVEDLKNSDEFWAGVAASQIQDAPDFNDL
jgi:hypothetical protein